MRTSHRLPEFVGFLAPMWNMYWYLDATRSRPVSALSCSKKLGMAREDVQRRRSHLGKYTLVQAIILCQHFRGRVRATQRAASSYLRRSSLAGRREDILAQKAGK